MRALTIWQPWASLIALGVKSHEFRTWPPPEYLYGARMAVHAAGRVPRRAELQALLLCLRGRDWRQSGLDDQARAEDLVDRWLTSPGLLPRSAVLCTAQVGRPLRAIELAAQRGIEPQNGGAFDALNFAWPLTDIEVFDAPIEHLTGSRELWRWDGRDA